MTHSNQYKKYVENTVFTSTPEELVLLAYNTLIKFILQAIAAMEEKDIEKANKSIIKAEDVISELHASLDDKYEIAGNMKAIYEYMKERLVRANIEKNIEILKEVFQFAKDFRDTWTEAMKIAKKNMRQNLQSNAK